MTLGRGKAAARSCVLRNRACAADGGRWTVDGGCGFVAVAVHRSPTTVNRPPTISVTDILWNWIQRSTSVAR